MGGVSTSSSDPKKPRLKRDWGGKISHFRIHLARGAGRLENLFFRWGRGSYRRKEKNLIEKSMPPGGDRAENPVEEIKRRSPSF